MTFSLPEASWSSLDLITVQRTETQKRLQSAKKHSGVSYFDCGIQTLRLAWTFLMVPLRLNQLCLLFAWVPMLSLRFHCLDMKSVRILRNRNEKQINGVTDLISGSVLINVWILTSVIVSRGWNDPCWMVEKPLLMVLWGEHHIEGCVTLKELNVVCSGVVEAHQVRSDTENSRSAGGWQWLLMEWSSRLPPPLSVHIREAWPNSQAEREHGLSVLLLFLHPESRRLSVSPRPRRRLTRTPCWKQARGRSDAGILPIHARTRWSDLTETVEPGHKDLTACMSASSWGWRCRSAARTSCRDKH